LKQGLTSAQADLVAAEAQKKVAEANLAKAKALADRLQADLRAAEKRVADSNAALEKAKAKLKANTPKKDDEKKADPKKDDDSEAGAAADRLLKLMARRLALMPQVAQAKWNAGLPIDDAKREEALLSRLVGEGAKIGLDADFTRRFF